MEYLIKFDTDKSGWSIVHNYNFQNYHISLNIDFVLTTSADPDEMPHDAAFHQGLHCLPKYPFRGFWYTKVICSLIIMAVFYISILHTCAQV